MLYYLKCTQEKIQHVDIMLFYCWASIIDGGPTLDQLSKKLLSQQQWQINLPRYVIYQIRIRLLVYFASIIVYWCIHVIAKFSMDMTLHNKLCYHVAKTSESKHDYVCESNNLSSRKSFESMYGTNIQGKVTVRDCVN